MYEANTFSSTVISCSIKNKTFKHHSLKWTSRYEYFNIVMQIVPERFFHYCLSVFQMIWTFVIEKVMKGCFFPASSILREATAGSWIWCQQRPLYLFATFVSLLFPFLLDPSGVCLSISKGPNEPCGLPQVRINVCIQWKTISSTLTFYYYYCCKFDLKLCCRSPWIDLSCDMSDQTVNILAFILLSWWPRFQGQITFI